MRWWRPLVVLPALKFIGQVAALPGYGVFRDELYYIACSERLALGYVDHPPLSVLILRCVREVLGPGIWPMRLTVAVAGALLVLLVGLATRRLGGSTRAEWMAMIAFLAMPSFWFTNHYFSMNAFDALFWGIAGLLVIDLTVRDSNHRRTWIALGVVLGFGLLNKLSVLWLGAGLAVGLLLTRQRRYLRTPGPWLAAGISGLLVLPHILWQWTHGWPTREFIANASAHKMAAVSLGQFVSGQVDLVGGLPGTLFLTLGCFAFFFGASGRRFSILGLIYLTVFVILMLNGTSRSGYLAPAYGWMFAAAACGLDAFVRGSSIKAKALVAFLVLVVVRGIMSLPFALPILAVDDFVAYSQRLGVTPSTDERKELSALPQHYADMFGWREKVEVARQVFEMLSAAEQQQACFLAFNYGVAGALENESLLTEQSFGTALPPVLSGHNNYWLWGPGECSGEVVIVMGSEAARLEGSFASVESAAIVECTHCMPYEDQQPVFIARGFNTPMAVAWEQVKHYD